MSINGSQTLAAPETAQNSSNLEETCSDVAVLLNYPNYEVTMIPMRVQRASHSSMEWVVRINEHFSLFVTMSEITRHMKRLATGSIPVDGSIQTQ